MSTSSAMVLASGRKACMNSRASALVLFIFQFAATNGLRSAVIQGLHAGKGLAFQQLERGAPAGGQVGDGIGQREALERGGRVAAADHGRAVVGSQRLGHGARAPGEAL